MIIEKNKDVLANLGAGLASVLSEVRGGTLPKTVLFEGKDKESRHKAALICACALMCKGESENSPCFECSQCQKVLSEHHADVTVFSCGDGKVKVDEIRDARRDAYQSPFEAELKIFLFSEAQGLNASSQNALLKILEEPPEHVYFLLTAPDSGLLLETVASRCTKFSLGAVTYGDVYRSVCEIVQGTDKEKCARMASAVTYLDGFEINGAGIKSLSFALDVCDSYYQSGVFPYGSLPSKKEDGDVLRLVFRLLALCALEVCESKKGAPMKNGILSKGALESAVMKMPMRTAFLRYEFFNSMDARLERNANSGAVLNMVRAEIG